MSRLIDADALKEAITQNREIDRNAVCDVLDIIDNAPTVLHDNYSMGYQDGVRKVLSERPQGEWIKDGEFYRCSECTSQELYPENFCYCCGADMRGGKE